MNRSRALLTQLTVLTTLAALASPDAAGQQLRSGASRGQELASRVEIVRTEYGVPHIFAEDLEAMGFALAYVQSEDYGDQVAIGLVKRRGTYARYVGADSIGGDFSARVAHARAAETFHRLDESTRAVYRGFAEGVNHYVRLHADEFPPWLTPDFTAIDAHAADVQSWSRGDAASFARDERQRLGTGTSPVARTRAALGRQDDFDETVDGSNAWALDGTRTRSGNPILLRNPHLAWTAGYYEAHVRVPGVLEFYGDFRIGGAFGIIGGFNERLGWATTNNSPTYSQVYALARHPQLRDHAELDGMPLPLDERTVSAEYATEDGFGVETEITRWSPFGPVIFETEETLYVLKDPRDGEFRRGEQFLRMMMATSLDEWLEVMRMRAHSSSNFTYADADGNIALYYNARIPMLPHEPTGDTAAVARSVEDIWSELVPWEQLPLYLNPPGGYVQQANDTPDYINLNVRLDRDSMPANLPDPRLRLRSQLSFDLVRSGDDLTLEDVVERKHSPRMLAAERMTDDLLSIVSTSAGARDMREALDVLAAWDRTARADSRGGVLFSRWLTIYRRMAGSAADGVPWSEERPLETPRGVGAPEHAIAALYHAVGDMRADGLALDVPWGDVHRVIRGDVDLPVSGCEGGMGCFRTLSFSEMDDGRLAADRGDGWIFVVELGGGAPRGLSVLAYGQSRLETSPHFDDQAALFAEGRMKPIRWTDEQIGAAEIRRYRPGTEMRR
ncbi:MAG: penicillin acylase family protein [Gemmatimonadota bacterium]|nr:penicillin acylase family protein [Gemmatimonadota bacterium]